MGLEVLDATPGQVGRVGTDATGKVAPVDQRHPHPAASQRRGRDGTVDSASDDKHVIFMLPQLLHIAVAQRDRHINRSFAVAGALYRLQ